MGQAARLRGPPPVCVPAVAAEASRDLGRARAEAIRDLKAAPFRLKPFGCGTLGALPAGPPGAERPAEGSATSSALPRFSPWSFKPRSAPSSGGDSQCRE